ncbi:endonuclease/exonuclease/phosphatase family protein [Paenibacillus flagellatus]|uniref:Endonuclease n=1 Tax=Paenibacillus flagellatus TaxID=2211139 RepID=A0A2V5KGW2_9BACL|nr:endonuclease/exonuclease/phosphatase family protein [Paenibacillus flagellatus]PYI53490.1 endonuclease [Paenibacillus flagellatus]
MTVMTFNLRYPETKDGANYWPHRIGRAAAAILENRPLVVGTQEGYHSMLTDLEPFLDGYAWVGEGRFGGRENEHNAVFYDTRELELVRHGQFWLSETPDTAASKSWESMFPRICTWASFVRREDGAAFYVYNTHLDHYSQAARDGGVRVIRERMRVQRESDGIPAVLLGDFNSVPGDWPIRFLRGETEDEGGRALIDAYSAMEGSPGLTAHGFRGGEAGEPIDYVFATPEFRVESVRVDRTEYGGGLPSDHYPIVAALSLG